MLIANPTYEIVFNKLMENMDIARGIFERILDTSIEQLEFASQEFTATSDDNRLTYFRLDFKARVVTPFRQDRLGDEAGHTLIVDEDSPHSLLINDILHNLRQLVEKPEVQRAMAIEDEMYEALARGIEEETRELKKAIREAERGREEAEAKSRKSSANVRKRRADVRRQKQKSSD